MHVDFLLYAMCFDSDWQHWPSTMSDTGSLPGLPKVNEMAVNYE